MNFVCKVRVMAGQGCPIQIIRLRKGVVPAIHVPYIVGNIRVEILCTVGILESKDNREPLGGRIYSLCGNMRSVLSMLEALIKAPMQAASNQLAREMCMLT
jgi:hypothetical protein